MGKQVLIKTYFRKTRKRDRGKYWPKCLLSSQLSSFRATQAEKLPFQPGAGWRLRHSPTHVPVTERRTWLVCL